MRYLHIGLMSLLALQVEAAVFENAIDKEAWKLEGSNLGCSLSLEIRPLVNVAFEKKAGHDAKLKMELKQNQKVPYVSVYAQSPMWHFNKMTPVLLNEYKISDRAVTVKHPEAEDLATTLSEGLALAVRLENGDEARLSPAGFSNSYKEYIDCLAQLLPHSYEQVQWSTITYPSGETQLSDEDKRRLDDIVTYYLGDKNMGRLVVDGHSDSGGSMLINRDLSKKRAQLVVEYLEASGINPNEIEMRFHGQSYPVASNSSAKGRLENRRVTVRMDKKPFPPRKPIDELDIYDDFNQARAIIKGRQPAIYKSEEDVARAIEADEILQAMAPQDDIAIEGLPLPMINNVSGTSERALPGDRNDRNDVAGVIDTVNKIDGLDPDQYRGDEDALRKELLSRGMKEEIFVDNRVGSRNTQLKSEQDFLVPEDAEDKDIVMNDMRSSNEVIDGIEFIGDAPVETKAKPTSDDLADKITDFFKGGDE